MGRVSKETRQKLEDFMKSLSENDLSKCSLCTETLTHITKMAEAETGAGTATVTRALAHLINESARTQDLKSAKALNNRVRRNEGKDAKNPNRENKDSPKQLGEPSIRENESNPVPLTSGKLLDNVVTGQRTICAALYNLQKLRDSKRLHNDYLFREVENQLRLINSLAQELGIKVGSQHEN